MLYYLMGSRREVANRFGPVPNKPLLLTSTCMSRSCFKIIVQANFPFRRKPPPLLSSFSNSPYTISHVLTTTQLTCSPHASPTPSSPPPPAAPSAQPAQPHSHVCSLLAASLQPLNFNPHPPVATLSATLSAQHIRPEMVTRRVGSAWLALRRKDRGGTSCSDCLRGMLGAVRGEVTAADRVTGH
jgi:hypothetical protein